MRQFVCIFIIVMTCATSVCAAVTCNSGYTIANTNSINIGTFQKKISDTCPSGYSEYTYNRLIVYPVRDVTHCPSGYYYHNGSCVQYGSTACETGFINVTPSVLDGTFDVAYAGGCIAGYNPIITRVNSAYVVYASKEKCGTGEYPTSSGCARYPTENCPDAFYAIAPTTAFIRPDENGECATDYSLFHDTDLCYSNTNLDLCATQLVCNGGVQTLRTSTGINLNIYRERATTPSMHFLLQDGSKCYLNLLSGTKNNTINIKYNNEIYHGVE